MYVNQLSEEGPYLSHFHRGIGGEILDHVKSRRFSFPGQLAQH